MCHCVVSNQNSKPQQLFSVTLITPGRPEQFVPIAGCVCHHSQVAAPIAIVIGQDAPEQWRRFHHKSAQLQGQFIVERDTIGPN